MAQSKKRDKNSVNLPQVPSTMKSEKSDGIDVEFSEEMADYDDLKAQERAKAAEERARARENNQ